jgi:hypothetical protein
MSKVQWEYDLVERPFCEQLKAMGWQWIEGDKNCHYDKVVQKVKWSLSMTGNPIISYDDEKSWQSFTPDPGVKVPQNPEIASVYISWSRVNDYRGVARCNRGQPAGGVGSGFSL